MSEEMKELFPKEVVESDEETETVVTEEDDEQEDFTSDDDSEEPKDDESLPDITDLNLEEKERDPENDSVDDDDEDEDETPFQRLEHPMISYNLEAIHPEIRACNYQEIMALSKVTRDEKGKIIDPLHTTLPFLTKYEKARIIGTRAEQIDLGSPPFVSVGDHIIQGRTIAMMEFDEKKIPFILARPLPNGGIEYWRVDDLEYL